MMEPGDDDGEDDYPRTADDVHRSLPASDVANVAPPVERDSRRMEGEVRPSER